MSTIEAFTENIEALSPKDFVIDVTFNTISFGLCKTIFLFTKRLKMTTFDVILDWCDLDVWLVQLKFPFGGRYKITTTSIVENQIVSISLKDVYFGDVWLCGGQSNMAFATNMIWAFLQRFLRWES